MLFWPLATQSLPFCHVPIISSHHRRQLSLTMLYSQVFSEWWKETGHCGSRNPYRF